MDQLNQIVARIVGLIRSAKIDVSNEKAAQLQILSLLEGDGMSVSRECQLSKKDIIDFLVDGVGVEVKLRGSKKASVFRQLERYSKHDSVGCLVLVSNLSMGLPEQIGGKDAFFVSLSEGWI